MNMNVAKAVRPRDYTLYNRHHIIFGEAIKKYKVYVNHIRIIHCHKLNVLAIEKAEITFFVWLYSSNTSK